MLRLILFLELPEQGFKTYNASTHWNILCETIRVVTRKIYFWCKKGKKMILNFHFSYHPIWNYELFHRPLREISMVFDLSTAHIPISAQSSNLVVFRLQPFYFYLLLYKNICCWYLFKLPRQVEAIQMSTNNKCFYKESQEKKILQVYAPHEVLR